MNSHSLALLSALITQQHPDKPEEIAMLDVQTAQLHMPFGLLLIISVILGGLL